MEGKKKKKQERKYHFVKKRKENLLRKRLVLAELHAGIQISNREVVVKPNIAIHDVENEVSFFCMQVPASTKILTIYISSNRNFESCMTIRCLAPQHIFRFSILPLVFPLLLATLLIIVSSSSMLFKRDNKINVSAMGYFSREILIHRK